MITPRTLGVAGTRSAISGMAGAGTRPSVTTRDLFGVAREKGTSAVLTRVMAGIRVHSMECWRTGLQGGLAFGVVGRDIGALSTRARQRAVSYTHLTLPTIYSV